MQITREEIAAAYFDCRRHKRYTYQAFKFEINYPKLLEELYQELVRDKYKPSPEIAFIINDPKIREIFAAMFKDRIVHHIFINRIKDAYEAYYADCSYNCRPGRGNIHACQKLQEYMTEGMWCLGVDIKSFFMSIDRKQTLSDLIKFIKLWINEDLVESTIELAKIILTNDVTKGCKKTSPRRKWEKLPQEKSLFGKSSGFPIGDITSQFNANFILTYIDNAIINHGFKMVRYADDMRIIGSKEDLIHLKNLIFDEIWTQLHLQLSKDKIILQPISRGIPFAGYFVKHDYMLPGKRLRHRAYCSDTPQNYFGFLQHCRAYKLMLKLIENNKPGLASR